MVMEVIAGLIIFEALKVTAAVAGGLVGSLAHVFKKGVDLDENGNPVPNEKWTKTGATIGTILAIAISLLILAVVL